MLSVVVATILAQDGDENFEATDNFYGATELQFCAATQKNCSFNPRLRRLRARGEGVGMSRSGITLTEASKNSPSSAGLRGKLAWGKKAETEATVHLASAVLLPEWREAPLPQNYLRNV